jgi:hypothetical protein
LELPRAWEPSDSSGALPDSEVKDVYYGFLNKPSYGRKKWILFDAN